MYNPQIPKMSHVTNIIEHNYYFIQKLNVVKISYG